MSLLTLLPYHNRIGMPSADRAHPCLLDLEDLESESSPLFVIKTGAIELEFDLLFCNQTFRSLGLRGSVLAQDRAALLFRSWAQALGDFKPEYEFGNRVWSAECAGRSGAWKVVRAIRSSSPDRDQQILNPKTNAHGGAKIHRTPVFTRSRSDIMKEAKFDKPKPPQTLPSTNLNARWESIQIMMEMSDVGVFEYNSEGLLLHANEAWYRLRHGNPQDWSISKFNVNPLQFSSQRPRVPVLLHGSRLSRRSGSCNVHVEQPCPRTICYF